MPGLSCLALLVSVAGSTGVVEDLQLSQGPWGDQVLTVRVETEREARVWLEFGEEVMSGRTPPTPMGTEHEVTLLGGQPVEDLTFQVVVDLGDRHVVEGPFGYEPSWLERGLRRVTAAAGAVLPE